MERFVRALSLTLVLYGVFLFSTQTAIQRQGINADRGQLQQQTAVEAIHPASQPSVENSLKLQRKLSSLFHRFTTIL
jgi:hypothetical protein